jgi:hypothetical protein
MNPSRVISATLLTMLGLALPRAWASKFTLFSSVWGDAIVVTDMTPAGRTVTPPTPAKPVYFQGLSLGSKLGSIPGDVIPEKRKFDQFIAKILARQGYLPAEPGVHEPTLFLIVQWGYLAPRVSDTSHISYMVWFLGYDPNKDIGANWSPNFLGPEVFLRDFRSRVVETIFDTAGEPAYGIIVTAFEYKSASTNHPIAYWQTRVGLAAVGKTMAQALPTMIVAAGPAIGRETASPLLRDADKARQGHVDLGQLKVVGYEDDPVPRRPSPDTKK